MPYPDGRQYAVSDIRTIADLERAVRALSTHFHTDTVVIIGSQSVLLEWPDAPILMRSSGEIDAYPINWEAWESEHPGEEASEEINALFGWGSDFHVTHGFYIDGVDASTATLPEGWRDRVIHMTVKGYGTTVTAIAPSPEDLIVSKLARLEEKDIAYIAERHRFRPLNFALIRARLAATEMDDIRRADAKSFLDRLEAS